MSNDTRKAFLPPLTITGGILLLEAT